MNKGRILAAEISGIPVLKFVGDVRVLMSSTIDNYFSNLYGKPILEALLIDLTETTGIDSTALGLLAKMAIQLKNRFNVTPTIISTNSDITRILHSMSFQLIFNIVDKPMSEVKPEETAFGELNELVESEEQIKLKVIEAHQTLMALSEDNKIEFQELVNALKKVNH